MLNSVLAVSTSFEDQPKPFVSIPRTLILKLVLTEVDVKTRRTLSSWPEAKLHNHRDAQTFPFYCSEHESTPRSSLPAAGSSGTAGSQTENPDCNQTRCMKLVNDFWEFVRRGRWKENKSPGSDCVGGCCNRFARKVCRIHIVSLQHDGYISTGVML